MFHSNQNAGRLQQLRELLKRVGKVVISQENIQQKSLKIRQNFISGYTIVYDMCGQKPSLQQKMLQQYKSGLSNFIETYIDLTHQQNPFRFSIQNSSRVINWFNILWIKYVKFMICISKKVFSYLDRHYLPGTDQMSLYKVGIQIFKKNVCHQHNVKFFNNCYFKQIKQIRENKLIQNNQLLKFSQAIAIIDSYQLVADLTKRFIQQTIAYFNTFYQKNSHLPSFQYFSKVYNTFLFEEVLIKMSICLNPFQITHIFLQFSQIIVQQYTQIFCGKSSLQHGLRKMFQTKNVDFMRIVNQVYRRFEGFDKIKQAYYEYLLQQGEHIIAKYKSSSSLQQSLPIIDEIETFYKNHLQIITIGFNKRNELLVTLNNAIQKIISRQQGFSSILYIYCSNERRLGTFGVNKQKITLLFDKVSSKDEFMGAYQNELFKKIAGNEIDIKKQEQFVQYLNGICGSEVTHKLIKKIKDLNEVPKNKDLIKLLPMNIQFNIHVLSLHLWEKKFTDQISLNIKLPQPIQTIWRGIQRNYTQLQPKKKLISLPFQNKLILQVRFNKRLFLIKCNLIQASIFTFLSGRAYTSEQDLILNLSIQKNVVQSTMQTFESIPHLILKTTLGDYIVNWYFDQTDSVIDLVSKTQQSNKQMQKAIKQDRQILVEAAIVKFIKRAKKGTFEQIVEGVIKGIRLFKPLPQIIKASVDKLLKKGFIQETEGGVLEYVE